MPFQDRRTAHHDADSAPWQPDARAPKKPERLPLPPARWPDPPNSIYQWARWQAETQAAAPAADAAQEAPVLKCEVVRSEGGCTVVRGLCYPQPPRPQGRAPGDDVGRPEQAGRAWRRAGDKLRERSRG